MHACGLVAVAADHPASLAPATTAGRLGISVRHLHQLFAGHERTFGAEARRQRLEQAHRDLADPARAGFRMADIAAEAGFADVTHFHRVFRQAYGCTPAGLRRESGAADRARPGPFAPV